VLVRGNQVMLDSTDEVQQQRFVYLMSELQEHSRDGREPDQGLINAIHRDLASDGGGALELLRSVFVDIPVAGKRNPLSTIKKSISLAWSELPKASEFTIKAPCK